MVPPIDDTRGPVWAIAQADTEHAWIDGKGPDGRTPGVWLLDESVERIEARRPDEVAPACACIDDAARTQHVVALLDYELGYWLEPRAALKKHALERAPLVALVFERAQWLPRTAFDAQLAAWVAALPEHARHAGLADLRLARDRGGYRDSIERILDYIRDGDCYQINFTWPMRFRQYGDALALYHALRRRQPVEHGAFIHLEDRNVLSLSPELFLERHGSRLHSMPMKGTAPRGATPADDHRHAEALRASEKDRAENVMIVDLIRNDLGRIATPGSVRVQSLFTVERYPTVLQMVSTVAADAPDAHLHDILRALFPCGSITGAPKIRAMQIADELEGEPRHLYTGSIGHIRPGGDFSFNVAIRTLEFTADGHGQLGIGGGIVADSDPDREYDECLDKARFATELPADFELIETLRIEPHLHTPCALLPLHLERLRDAARHFGFPCDEAEVRRALEATLRNHADDATLRVRLTLAHSGRLQVQAAPLASAAPFEDTPTVVLAEKATDSTNPFLHYKTTVRGLYDDALQHVGTRQGCFDALFFNERGELTEGARSNVYIVRDGAWYTPPLGCGLLNGVMRRHLLATHAPRIRERVLRRDDLLSADEIWLSNALRGLFRVRLATDGAV